MRAQGMRSFFIADIVRRGLDDVVDEAVAHTVGRWGDSGMVPERSTSTSSTPAWPLAPAAPSRAA
ncbi:MAG: hypothetical protein ACRD0K_21635 [Egibacteraceae bacterium]